MRGIRSLRFRQISLIKEVISPLKNSSRVSTFWNFSRSSVGVLLPGVVTYTSPCLICPAFLIFIPMFLVRIEGLYYWKWIGFFICFSYDSITIFSLVSFFLRFLNRWVLFLRYLLLHLFLCCDRCYVFLVSVWNRCVVEEPVY